MVILAVRDNAVFRDAVIDSESFKKKKPTFFSAQSGFIIIIYAKEGKHHYYEWRNAIRSDCALEIMMFSEIDSKVDRESGRSLE